MGPDGRLVDLDTPAGAARDEQVAVLDLRRPMKSSSRQATLSMSISMIRKLGTHAEKCALIAEHERPVEVVRRHVDLVGLGHRGDLDRLRKPFQSTSMMATSIA